MIGNTIASAQPLVVVGNYADAAEPGVHVFHFDTETGALVVRGSCTGIDNPSFLTVHPNERWLYAVSETSEQDDGTPGSVWALRLEREPLAIEPINQQPSGGDSPCHVQLDRSARWLVVSNYGTGSVAVLPIQSDGSLGEITDIVQHEGKSVHPDRQAGPHAHSAAFAPDNHFVVVADLGIDQLLVYAFDSTAGKLGAHSQIDTRPGAGPRHMVFHPSGERLYVANELNNTVSVYDYDAASGALHERQTIDTLLPGAPENTVADIHLASSGRRLYVSNRGHNSIAVFDVKADARLEPVAVRSCGGAWPRNFALAPGNRFILVANQHSDKVSVLPLFPDSQAIGEPVGSAAVRRASCVQWVET
jgi:6-phosphogluconolactonase